MDDYNNLLFQAVQAAYPGDENVTPEWVATLSPEQLEEIAQDLDGSYHSNRGAFKNPEDFARQRFEYAKQGATPEEVQQRWDESTTLLDPATAEADRTFGRHARFLRGHLDYKDTGVRPEAFANTFGAFPSAPPKENQAHRSHAMSYQSDLDAGDYQLARGSQKGDLRYTMTDPSTGVGSYMNSANIVPNAFRYSFGGMTDGALDAFDQSVGHLNANKQNRLGMYNPSLDLPDDATPEQVNQRFQEMRGGYENAQAPSSKERYLRSGYDLDETFSKALGDTMGKAAADAVYLGSDVVFDMADPSLAATTLTGIPGVARNVLGGLAKQGFKQGVKQAATSAVKAAPKSIAPDFGLEAGLQAGLGGFGNEDMQLPTQEQDEKNQQFRRQRRDDAVGYKSPSDETYENQVAPLVQRLRHPEVGGGGGGGFHGYRFQN